MANRNKWWISPETLVGIANAIRSKKGTTDLIPVTELEAEIMSIVGDGGSWCGEYVEGTNYKSGAIVSFEGNIYLCIKDLDDQQDPTNAEYWKMLNEPPNLISKTITENGTYKINEKSALGIWRLNSDFKITSVIDVRTEIEGTFVAVAEDGTIQELPLRRFRLNTFDNNTYGTLALKSSRHGFPYSGTTIFDHKQTIRLETYDASAGLLYDQQDIPLDSELGEQLRYFTITNVGVMQIGTEEALTEWLYANCTKIANIDGYSEVIVNVEPALEELTATANGEYTPSGDGYSKVTVSVEAEDSAIPIEVSTEAEMTALLTSGEVGGVYKYTGTTGTYENGALYVLENDLITFTIDGTEFQAESGMTWAEWVESNYNTNGFVIDNATTYVFDSSLYNNVRDGEVYVDGTTTISATSYTLGVYSGGGGQ